MSGSTTPPDAGAKDWIIHDEVTSLRFWGTDVSKNLPPRRSDRWTIGSGDACMIKIDDPLVSREHAWLFYENDHWVLRDLRSRNGLWRDGMRESEIVLEPGIEIKLGKTVLVPESPLLLVLRNFLARLLGWKPERNEVVDLAVRSVRASVQRRNELILQGEGDLVPIAYALHRKTLGDNRPFVVCDPRRGNVPGTVRVPANVREARDAYDVAHGGAMCIRSHRLPADFGEVMPRLRSPDTPVQLVVCAGDRREFVGSLTRPIEIPPLVDRADELTRIIEEYAEEAENALGAAPGSVDRVWVRDRATSLHEIEKATMRLAALRSASSVSAAAQRLGMAPVSLARWMGRRKPAVGPGDAHR